jgi:hypothetical protein
MATTEDDQCRMEESDYLEELIDLRATARRQAKDVVFGALHIWTQSDTLTDS